MSRYRFLVHEGVIHLYAREDLADQDLVVLRAVCGADQDRKALSTWRPGPRPCIPCLVDADLESP